MSLSYIGQSTLPTCLTYPLSQHLRCPWAFPSPSPSPSSSPLQPLIQARSVYLQLLFPPLFLMIWDRSAWLGLLSQPAAPSAWPTTSFSLLLLALLPSLLPFPPNTVQSPNPSLLLCPVPFSNSSF